MANIRTLKLNLLADTTDFARGIKKASGQTESFSTSIKNSMKSLAKSAAVAGAAVGSMAIAFGVDAVKSAVEDQKSQKLLQRSLANTTKATDKQRRAVEKWITKQQFAYGFSDSKLRPNLAKLARATGSLSKAQNLLSLAMDVSAGTGKDLDTVTQALSRAQMGNLTSLKKLGVPLTETIIKNKDLKAAMELTAKTFKGSASAAAQTFAGKMEIFNQRVSEAKETIGTKLLTVLQPLADKWLPKISTGVTTFVDTLTGQGNFNDAVKDGSVFAYDLAQKTLGFFNLLKRNKDTLETASKLIAAIFIGAKAGAAVSAMRTALGLLVGTFGRVTVAAGTAAGAEAAATGGASLWAAVPAITAIGTAFGISKLLGVWDPKNGGNFNQDFNNYVNSGGAVTTTHYGSNDQPRYTTGTKTQVYNGTTYQWDPVAKKWYVPDLSGGRDYSVQPPGGAPRNFMRRTNPSMAGGAPVTININGVVDAESARRSIEKVLQSSSVRTQGLQLGGSLL